MKECVGAVVADHRGEQSGGRGTEIASGGDEIAYAQTQNRDARGYVFSSVLWLDTSIHGASPRSVGWFVGSVFVVLGNCFVHFLGL